MDKRQVVEKLLRACSNGQWNMSSAFGNAGSMTGRPQVLQADTNKAIELWLKENNPDGIRQLAGTLHITGALTDVEHEQIMEALENT